MLGKLVLGVFSVIGANQVLKDKKNPSQKP